MSGHDKRASQPVAADSVHVWRGYVSATTTYDKFATFLGTVFLPACSLLQPNAGLRAYVPSMPSQTNKPASVPDQTALMFWADQATYTNAFKTPAVRAYTNLHGDAYDTTKSLSGFPIALSSSITAEQPYHLLDNPADWMLGHVRHFVGARQASQPSRDFLSAIQTWAAAYRLKPPAGVDGAILVAGNDYLAFWEHWRDQTGNSAIDQLSENVTSFLFETAQNVAPGGGLWDDWPGWNLAKFTCMNVQLDRPHPKGK